MVADGLLLPVVLLDRVGVVNSIQRKLELDQAKPALQVGSAVRTVQLAPESTPGSQEELGREARGRPEERVMEAREEA